MTEFPNPADRDLPFRGGGFLPPQMRVLYITSERRTGGWLAEAFASDSAVQVVLDEISGVAAALSVLRDESFDAVLIGHDDKELDGFELIDAVRAGTSDDQPIIVLGESSEDENRALCFEAGGDAYLCVQTATIRTLIWELARAVQRHELVAENRRMREARKQRLQMEHEEASRLLQQQRAMIEDLEQVCLDVSKAGQALEAMATSTSCPDLPPALVHHYRELLRAYVIMGAGNLSEEMNQLGNLLSAASVTAQQAMLLHLFVLEELIRGLGSRSARHIMNRADLLILEVMINLADHYRERFLNQVRPPVQRELPGFENARDALLAELTRSAP